MTDFVRGDRVFVRLREGSKNVKVAMYNGRRGTVVCGEKSGDFSMYIVNLDVPIGWKSERFRGEDLEKFTVLDLLAEIDNHLAP